MKFKKVAYKNYLSKKEELNKVEASAFGKYIVAYADDEKSLRRDLKEARTMLEKEKAFSCYLYDCREAILTKLYSVENRCPQVDRALEHYKEFDLMASKRLEEKIKTIKKRLNGQNGWSYKGFARLSYLEASTITAICL